VKLEASRHAGGVMHYKRRSSGRVDVVERRLRRTVAARAARVIEVLAVRGAARVAAIVRVVAAAPVRVRRVSGVLGRQQARPGTHRNLHDALALHRVKAKPKLIY